ncbi:immunity 22 family protein [Piscinibacter gummiphilus]|uniref:Uncharacterized protein n=1 Tax=Piscinibacter gummiphilus TaxID=946333 RepID=A0ABZ0CPW9_9BURK|nr:immunity 22 family protein [Piscinibacter gummiphilus]WOB06939.1 hypothetical protein RXV79_18675 [Piscinibacter gummiphilus]
MARRDYSEDEDYYTQDLERDGVVSIWAGLSEGSSHLDVLQDLCGVGYYSLDNQEGMNFGFRLVPVSELLDRLSYSSSFAQLAVEKAKSLGLSQARWVTIQYDFAYSPEKVRRPIAQDPVFLGVFKYSAQVGQDA